MLRALGVANLVDNYDGALLGLALPQIQASLAVGDDAVGQMIAIVRLGVIPAIVLTVLADRIGRRRLLLTTIIGFTVLTFLTALVGDVNQFMTVQFLARIFVAAENILAIVVIAEEFDARNRGWGIGILGAMGALGYALASVTFSVVNLLPFGWRALYGLGVLPLLLVMWMRRSLHETRRFEAERVRHGGGMRAVLQPLRNLIRMYPGRMLALCAALFPYARSSPRPPCSSTPSSCRKHTATRPETWRRCISPSVCWRCSATSSPARSATVSVASGC